ncbi:MAG: ferrous iron transport protein B [Desulfobacteraceae bacterium]|nr:MAG: ferrous iron transport protein B [Desulfobacteraceae bacterium]
MIRIALVGQPNCGKSVLFNSVAGYKTAVSNFPGTTVEYVCSDVCVDLEEFQLVDLPGIYSLSSPEKHELLTRDYLLNQKPDAVVNILDASVLSRSLELTIELLDLNIPLVVCLNMMDEAARKGVQIDVEHLSLDLGVPVIPAISTRGQGIPELFQAAVQVAVTGAGTKRFHFSRDVEEKVAELTSSLDGTADAVRLPSRLFALQLLQQDSEFESLLRKLNPNLLTHVERLRSTISESHGRPSDMVVSSERHSLAMNLFEHVAVVKPREKRSLRDQVDRYIMHPLLGYVILGLVLVLFFTLVFTFGKVLETPLLALFQDLNQHLSEHLNQDSIIFTLLKGLIEGFSGGVGIVLPYLVPFLFCLSVLEDVGYLPRAAFLMDSIMHRIGLHGKSIIPFVLGYGCNVPAIMGVRILERGRDRFITAVLSTFIPCAARTTVIFAVVAFYLGPLYAAMLYLINLLVIAVAGKVLSRIMPEITPGMVLEIPSYKAPNLRAVINKIWFRLREFIVIAWPLLIAGSLILSLLDYLRLSDSINRVFSPFTVGLLGLPEAVSITLIFGILRKELTVIMLVQALGTTNFAAAMSHEQLFVFTVFSLFYIPCLATLGMLRSVIGNLGMGIALVVNTSVGTVIALISRVAFRIF